jgi:crotonobetainyl-CoA:carnitine CoA-transferase CaiB-like acyl-CoA transferase
VNDVQQMVDDPHTSARRMIQHVDMQDGDMQHGVSGVRKGQDQGVAVDVGVIGHPIKYSQCTEQGMQTVNTDVTRPAPRLGQHTMEVLMEAGYTSSEVDALAEEGAALIG